MSGPPPFPADFYFKEGDVLCQQGCDAQTNFLRRVFALKRPAHGVRQKCQPMRLIWRPVCFFSRR
jgi:hypothetical protein